MGTRIKCRFVEKVGFRHYAICRAHTDNHWHHAERTLTKEQYDEAYDGLDWREPIACEGCGAIFTPDVDASTIMGSPMYNTEDGKLHVGDMYLTHCISTKDDECYYWGKHCSGQHLIVQIPDKDFPQGRAWNVDSRASNCTMKDDQTHRCWVRHGEPPNVHVDKNGHTCHAGAGSILTDNWHGFLHNGELVEC